MSAGVRCRAPYPRLRQYFGCYHLALCPCLRAISRFVNALFSTPMRRQADFFCGKRKGINFPYSSGFVAFFLKLLGTKNSMIVAIITPPRKNKAEAKKFSF